MAGAWPTSIDRQLQAIILTVSAAALLLMGAFLVWLDLYLAKEGTLRELSKQADLLTVQVNETVQSADPVAGEHALGTLRLYPAVSTGILYDTHGREFARYERAGPRPTLSVADHALQAAIGTDTIEIRRLIPTETGSPGAILLQTDFSPIYDRAKRYIALVIAILFIGLTVAWILGGRLQRLITGPILDLTAVAGTVLTERDFSLRVQKPDHGDLGILVERFNRLLEQIQERDRTLTEQRNDYESLLRRREDEQALTSARLQDEIAQRTLAEEQLRQAMAQLESSRQELQAARDRSQDLTTLTSRFLADLHHDIRRPMNGLLGMMDLLLHTTLTEQQRHYATTTLSSGKTLMALLNDMATLANLESGALTVHTIDFDLRDTVEEVLDLFSAPAQAKGLRLACTIPSTCPAAVVGDPYRLRQILGHVLGHALTFTQQGEIELHVSAAPLDERRTQLRFEVRDTGIGIAAKDQARLLDSFSQIDERPFRKYDGADLGLSIAGRLVRLMGGALGLDSQVGRGTTFWFMLPLPIGSTSPPSVGELSSTTPVKVLVVETHTPSRQVLKHTLKGWGLHPEEASRGTEALAAVKQASSASFPFAVAVLDLALDDMDGLSLVKALRDEPGGVSLPVMLLVPSEFDHEIARQAGVEMVLDKPVRYQALYRALARLLSRSTSSSPPSVLSIPSIPSIPPAASINPDDSTRPQFAGHILVVEDNSVNQEVARTMLEQFGCSVDIAGNGLDALQAIDRTRYDLVLMDCHMPVMDGFEATRRIRAREASQTEAPPRLPIVALTAHMLESDRQSCLSAGMDDYLSKPYTRLQLERMLARWLPRPEQPSPSGT